MPHDLASRDGNVKANLEKWDRDYAWPKDGDEWDGQAAVCGVPYDAWKKSLVGHLIVPFGAPDKHALEIAPGHGRWTEFLIANFGRVTLVDLSPKCLAFCEAKFAGAVIATFVSDGSSLPPDATETIDFAFSYDAFVHMAPAVIDGYVREIARVLKPGGQAVIHHADVPDAHLHQQAKAEGWRSAMTAALMMEYAEEAGLRVVSLFTYWDEARKIGVPRFRDKVTILKK